MASAIMSFHCKILTSAKSKRARVPPAKHIPAAALSLSARAHRPHHPRAKGTDRAVVSVSSFARAHARTTAWRAHPDEATAPLRFYARTAPTHVVPRRRRNRRRRRRRRRR
ncbi:hypothetical protein PUN28_000237 [Cardiocondyla obscurior]|uniref:Uncharacterized protein n=1 Tax=Cardiocondyla obscurior TaxID=286306 RepID=A0AAW2GYD3_9HYME